jgi:hypothetical protein
MFALGLVYWLYDRPLQPTLDYLRVKFAKKPPVLLANSEVLKAGYHFGETAELFGEHYQVPKARLAPGTYRKITGNEATAIGMIAAGELAGKQIVYCSYPITPASDILHQLSLVSGQKLLLGALVVEKSRLLRPHVRVHDFNFVGRFAACGGRVSPTMGG